jgi:predicted O-methyltransferase YrrM
LVIGAHLAGKDLNQLHDPVAYVRFLQDAVGACQFRLDRVKSDRWGRLRHADRFGAVTHALERGAPPLSWAFATAIADIADEMLGSRTPRFNIDIGLNFAGCSSFGVKGRLLATLVRFLRPYQCLELGTAYGMSALFICGELTAIGQGHLTTVESEEVPYRLAQSVLGARYPGLVDCVHGLTEEVVPDVVRALPSVDFMFHDAAHSADAYVGDFNRVEPALGPGSVVLFDDIRWEPPEGVAPTRAKEGWLEVVAHPRVRCAVEVNTAMGLVFVGD